MAPYAREELLASALARLIGAARHVAVGAGWPLPPPPAARAQADTLRLRVTIIGANKTKGGLATATRVTPLGFATSALKSAMGRTGTFTGSLLYAVELYDARSNELLLAAVRRRTPDPLDVPATLSTTDTVKAIAREFADGARKRLQELTGTR